MHANDPFATTPNPATTAAQILGPLSIDQRVLAVAVALVAAGFEENLRTAVFQASEVPKG